MVTEELVVRNRGAKPRKKIGGGCFCAHLITIIVIHGNHHAGDWSVGAKLKKKKGMDFSTHFELVSDPHG